MDLRKLLAQQFRDRRKEIGLRREDVASRLQCSMRTLEDIETGRGPFPLERLQKCAAILNLRLVVQLEPQDDTQNLADAEEAA